jgi:hypothetical protein
MKTPYASIFALALLGLTGCMTGPEKRAAEPQTYWHRIQIATEPANALVTCKNQAGLIIDQKETQDGIASFAVAEAHSYIFSAEAEGYQTGTTPPFSGDWMKIRLAPTEETAALLAMNETEKRRAELAPKIAAIKELTPEMRDAISLRQILAGMPCGAVELAWGKPETKTIDDGVGERWEFWHYHGDTLYFRDGLLVRWSLHRRGDS